MSDVVPLPPASTLPQGLILTTGGQVSLLSKLIGVVPNKTPVSTDESLWALALSEFNGLNRRPGLWAQSLAGANGDESKAQAAYLKARYDELAGQHVRDQALAQAKAEALAKTQAQAEARARVRVEVQAQSWARAEAQREARATASAWVNAKVPQNVEKLGQCPGCNFAIPLESEECPCCGLLIDGSPGSLRITPI